MPMREFKLIADAGSTKVEWGMIPTDGTPAVTFVTEGINALLADGDDIMHTLRRVAESLPADAAVTAIDFYGAGCATPAICGKMEEALRRMWNPESCSVNSDLLGAARALFGTRHGIACILGTGSNSCLYRGGNIASQIPSLGYVLGDEGSGTALGKRLIADAFKMQLPENIREKFLDEYGLTLPEILERVYRRPNPNKFLASFVPFLKSNLWNPYIFSLVLEELTAFFKRNVAMYKDAHSLEVSFVGSIASNFENVLKEAAASQGYRVNKVCQSPMEGLLIYHSGGTDARS